MTYKKKKWDGGLDLRDEVQVQLVLGRIRYRNAVVVLDGKNGNGGNAI